MFKKIINYIKRPPFYIFILSFILCLIFVILSIIALVIDNKIFGYLIYPIAFILLVYTIYLIVIKFKIYKQNLIDYLSKYKVIDELISNYGFRTLTFSVVSLIINVGFALFNETLGIINSSSFYITIGIYYLLLAVLKFTIFINNRKIKSIDQNDKKIFELNIYEKSGIIMLILDICFISSVIQMILGKKSINNNEIIAIAMAAFTFYKLSLAIYNLFKARRYNNYVIQAVRNITFVDALTSLISLEVTMLYVFQSENDGSMFVLKIVTGCVVSIMAMVISIYMIINSIRQKKVINDAKEWLWL